MKPFHKRLDKLDNHNKGRNVFVCSYGSPQEEIDALLAANGITPNDSVIIFKTLYENKDGTIAPPNQPPSISITDYQ